MTATGNCKLTIAKTKLQMGRGRLVKALLMATQFAICILHFAIVNCLFSCQRSWRFPGLALLALAVLVATAAADREELPDPLPLRRVVLPPARLAEVVRQARDGTWRQMPRRQFDALVREAARAVKHGQQPPRLVEARYRASLTEGLALVGTAQWKVLNPGARPALLRLQEEGNPFNLAVARPRYDNRDALLAEFPDPAGTGKAVLALLVDQPGAHTVTLDWSARAEVRPEGLQVDLRLPACPAAALELNLPADRSATTLDGTLVSGPHTAESADRRLWRIAVGGRSHVPLLVRRGGPGRNPPVLLARQKTVQKLTPDGLESSTTLTVEVLHQDIRELTIEHDPILRPVDVSAPYLERWVVQSASQVLVRFERPLREATLKVQSLAPLSPRPASPATAGSGGRAAAFTPWTSPGLSLTGAVPRGETLELWLHPELRLANWNPGDYRLVDSSSLVDPRSKVTMRRLVLEGGGLAVARGSKRASAGRPGALVQAGGVEFHTRQLTFWRLGPDGMDLTVQLDCHVRHGLLFQLPLRLPAGWEVDSVELTPAQRLRSWGVRWEGGRSLLLVDLRKPLQALSGGQDASAAASPRDSQGRLLVRLRPAPPGPLTGRALPFPDPVLLGGRFREGGLALGFDPRVYRARVATTSPASDVPPEGPWGQAVPEYYYPYSGDSVPGTVHLEARRPRFRARAVSDVFVTAGRAGLETQIVLEGESGHPAAVDVYLAPGANAPAWEWRVARGNGPPGRTVRALRLAHLETAAGLASLGAGNPLTASVAAASRPAGTFWRLHLDRPLRPGQSLTLKTARPLTQAGPAGRPFWEVPLPVVLGASRSDGEVTLYPGGADQVGVSSWGLRAGPPSATSLPRATAWRTFRYGDVSARLTLWARGHGERGTGPGGAEVVDQAWLTTTLTAEGTLRHYFRFRLARWPRRTVPVRLPAGVRLEAAAVDGHWLSRVEQRDGEPLELPVPVTAGAGPRFEVLYTSAAPTGLLWSRLEAPAPVLPVVPAVFERRWLLPPGQAPLSGDRVERLPPDEPLRPFLSPAQRLAGLLEQPLPRSLRLAPAEPARQALTDAVAAFKARHAGQKLSLEQVVEDLAFGYLKDAHPLIVDRVALARAGAGRATALETAPRPAAGRDDQVQPADTPAPWEAAGLILVPARSGVLLTSQAQAERWGREADGADEWPAGVDDAVARAAREGHDSSGRFLAALEWLSEGPAGPAPALLRGTVALEGWTTWQPVAHDAPQGVASDGEADDVLVVVSQRCVLALGLLLALVLTAALVLLSARVRRGRRALLLGWLAVAGVLLAWLPAALADLAWWPLLAGFACACVWFVAWAAWRRGRRARLPKALSSSGKKVLAGAATAGALLALGLVGLSSSAHGQKSRADVVILVPAATAARETVLVGPDVVDRLRALARSALAPTEGVVLASAVYEGKLVNGQAEFTAILHAHALGDGPATLELPLDGAQLVGDVLVDGARAFPVALAAPKTGYALKVKGKGRHKVELRFQAAVSAGTGDGQANPGVRQVRFSVPRLVQSRLVFRPGPGASHLQAPVKHGAQVIAAEPGGQRLDVDLGAVSAPVQLRWYQEGKQPQTPRLEFQEAYVWNLAPDASTLTAYLRYRISGGATSTLQVGLPADLEVRTAQARRPAGSGPTDASVRLSDWYMTSGPAGRILRLDMPGPVAGEVELTLELVPRAGWPGNALLPLPRPLGQPLGTVSYLAYRTQGLAAVRNLLRLSGLVDKKDFAPFWPAATRPAPATLTYASTFRPGDPRLLPQLSLQLSPQRPRVEARQDVTWRVGPRQAELAGRALLTAAGGDLVLAEWDLGSSRVVLTDVTGPDVRRWTQYENRLVVWLAGRTRQTRVELAGWVPLSLPAAGQKSARPGRFFELPCVRATQTDRNETRLTLACEPGLGLVPREKAPWNLVRQGPAQVRPLVYTGKLGHYGGTFAVVPAGPAAHAAVRTEVARRGKDLVFTTTIDYRPEGEPRPVEVRLRQWRGEAWLEAPAKSVTRRRETYRSRAGRRERNWVLELAPGQGRAVRLVLRGALGLDEAGDGAPAPDVTVVGARGRQEVVVDSTLVADAGTGLKGLAAPGPGRQGWEVTGPEWGLRLMPATPAQVAEVRVVMTEHRARLARTSPRRDDPVQSRWLHEVSWWLWQDGPSALSVTWPAGVDLLSALVDGQPVALVRRDQDQLWLPLSGPAGARHVLVRFGYSQGRETLARPDLSAPRPVGAQPGPTVWTVDVPPGWHLSAGTVRGLRGPSRRATVELYRAQAQLVLSQLLRENTSGDEPALAQMRGRLARSLRLAGLALDAGAEGSGPDGHALAAWRSRLRSAAADLVENEERGEPVSGTWAGGTAVSWAAPSGDRSPPVRLVPDREQQVQGAVLFSAWWLGGLVLFGVATLSSALRALARWLWPEALLLAGVAAGQVVGLTAAVVVLVLAGILARVVLVALLLGRVMTRPARQVPGSSGLRG
jgi:hypothetical protein